MTVEEAKRIVLERYPNAYAGEFQSGISGTWRIFDGDRAEHACLCENQGLRDLAWFAAASRIKEGEGK